MKRDEGVPTLEAALEGAKLRLRPILMTSFAFILGWVPLMLASGSGAALRSTMGTGEVFGMTISTLSGLLSWEIDFWGGIRRNDQAARARLLEAQYQRDGVQTSRVAAVASAYLHLQHLDTRLAISGATAESRKELP